MSEPAGQEEEIHYTWHPGEKIHNTVRHKPPVVRRAYDSYIEIDHGQVIIDAISSWWCKVLGHNHPTLKQVLITQIDAFEHVIVANTTNDAIDLLSKKLATITGLDKVFYAGDGSCAIEVALKMSLHARHIRQEKKRDRFVALNNSYHGETLGALSVSDAAPFRQSYHRYLIDPIYIKPLYVNSEQDPHWHDAKTHWERIEKQLESISESVTAIIVEPIVQGAGGMKLYSQDFLFRLATFAKSHKIHLIADEIMTGLGRTGRLFACEHANITPDFICLSKAITSGWMPFSAVITTHDIHQLFLDGEKSGHAFLHSHTYSGHVMGACLANATIDIIQSQQLCQRAVALQNIMRPFMETIANHTGRLTNIRGIGGIMAADVTHLPHNKQSMHDLVNDAMKLGILLRPIKNTLYWLPPLTVSNQTLSEIKDLTLEVLM